MINKFLITSQDDLELLAEFLIDDNSPDISVTLKQGQGSVLGSGLPEIVELIIAIGGAGGFIALQRSLKSYFDATAARRSHITITDMNTGTKIEIDAHTDVIKALKASR